MNVLTLRPAFFVSLVFTLVAFATLAGCSRPESGSHSHGGHAHTAPHGGTLVELGDHAHNLELVRDIAAGKLTAYVLDGHAENFIRIPALAFDLVVTAGGEKRPLTLRAVANSATGETIGDTSQFEAQADWLKTAPDLAGAIPALEIRGTKYENIAISVAK